MPNLNFVLVLPICIFVSGCYESTPKFSGNLDYQNSEFDDDADYLDSNSVSYQESEQEGQELEQEHAPPMLVEPPESNKPHKEGEAGAEPSMTDPKLELSNDFQPGTSTSNVFVNMLRVWKDAKGEFSTNAELMAVATTSSEVRLLKQNGVTITVPVEILSDHDKNYVTEFINAERQNTTRPTPQLVDVFENQ